jgi:hypothetical protein
VKDTEPMKNAGRMSDAEIDEFLEKNAHLRDDCDPRLLASIAASLKSSLGPVRPLPRASLLTSGLVVVSAGVALAGAAHGGLFGVARMDWLERWLVFSTLATLACLTASALVRQMIPASRIRLTPSARLLLVIVALLAVFAFLFRDDRTTNFVSAGIACLLAGLLYAIPGGLLGWWLLRRGFAVNPVSAGLAAGTLAGLAGLGMLELHCPNFQAGHILVWHTAVVPVSGALGALLGRLVRSFTRSGRPSRS